MNKQRALTPLALGAVGLILGVVAAVAGIAWVGLIAGAAALAAGALGYQLAVSEPESSTKSVPAPARRAEDAAALQGQITELEAAVASQMQARLAAEEAVKSLGEQLASAQAQRPVGNAADAPSIAAPVEAPNATVASTASGALTDVDSGLFSEDYFRVAVDARIAAARRHLRPVAVGLISVISGDREQGIPTDPTIVGPVLVETLRDSDTACRLSDGRYGLVLEDTPENGAIWTLERIRRSLGEKQDGTTMWAGLACYPAHAFDGGELMRQAEQALTDAQEWHQDRIEVATADS